MSDFSVKIRCSKNSGAIQGMVPRVCVLSARSCADGVCETSALGGLEAFYTVGGAFVSSWNRFETPKSQSLT